MKQRNGFTLIELMIVVAIIAILAALIVPSLIQNRIQANETAVIGEMRKYADAQAIFQKNNFSAVEGNSTPAGDPPAPRLYADNFSNLFYGSTGANPPANLQLIDKAFADARTEGSMTGKTRTNAAVLAQGGFAPHHGYLFNEDANVAAGDWPANFALVAYPASYGSTGGGDFWIGAQGVVLQRKSEKAAGTAPEEYAAGATPYPDGAHADWVGADF